MFSWFKKKVKYKNFPFFVIWEIWKMRNRFIFRYINPYLPHIYAKIFVYFKQWDKDDNLKNPKIYVRPSMNDDISIAFFVGVEKYGWCGAGMFLNFRRNHSIILWMGV